MLELGKGYQVAAGQDLAEGYEQTSETYLTANVGVNKLVEVCQHFIAIHEEPMFFILELPVTAEREKEVAPGVLTESHRDVYYLDGCSQEVCLWLLEQYGDLLINDGMSKFGFGCHQSQDEIMLGQYNVVTIYSQQLENYADFFAAHEIFQVNQLVTAWDTFSAQTPGKSVRVDYQGKSVYDLPAELKEVGLYLGGTRVE